MSSETRPGDKLGGTGKAPGEVRFQRGLESHAPYIEE